MKNLLSAILFSCLILACSHRAFAANDKSDPSQFPLAVHISGTGYNPFSADDGPNRVLEIVSATINGKHYQLYGRTSSAHAKCCNGLINPGDYRARLSKDEHRTSYESSQEFEILFPDGTTRNFEVIAQSE